MQSMIPLQQSGHSLESVTQQLSKDPISTGSEETPYAMTRQRPGLKNPDTLLSQYSSYEETLGLSKIIQPRRRSTDHTGARCRIGTCPCCCHLQLSLTWRNLTFRFTNPTSLFSPCNHRACKGQNISMATQLRISNSTIRFALLTSLTVSWTPDSIQVLPILRAERLVDIQSPGFKIVGYFCARRLSLQQAALALNQAFDSGEASRMDCTLNSSLADMILLNGSCWPRRRQAVEYLQLLEMIDLRHGLLECPEFLNFFKGGFIDKDPSFLEALERLDVLFNISSTDLCSLPSSGWLPRECGPSLDPFCLDDMKRWIAKCPGFGDVPDGIERIFNHHICPPDRLACNLSVPKEECWLGVSPIFWASTEPTALQHLLAQGHNPNLINEDGRTPIFYAAACGKLNCVRQLLKAGAQPDIKDKFYSRNFLYYAMDNGHPYVAIESLEYLLSTPACSDKVFQTLLHESLFFASERTDFKQSLLLIKRLCRLGVSPEALSSDGKSLGLILKSLDHAEVIFEQGCNFLKTVGRMGESSVHFAAQYCNVRLVRLYIGKGARLQERDIYGQNAIHKSFTGPIDPFSGPVDPFYIPKPHAWYATVRILIEHGVDALLGDHCRCVCSRTGCTPAKVLYKSWNYRNSVYPACILSTEYVMLLEELTGDLAAESVLAELIRLFLFEEFELTHVCCQNYGPRLDEEEISEIQDKERILIDQLEEEIDAVLKKSTGRNAADLWEEFLLEFVVEKSRAPSTKHQRKCYGCHKLTCLESWHIGLSNYSTFIKEIYDQRLNDETTYDLNNTWLQRRTSMIQRWRSKTESQG
jgi:hypothetical protein